MQKLQVDSRARALIFDLDGTLADTMPLHYRAWQSVADRHDFHFPEELFYAWAGIPTTRIARLLNEKFGYSLEPLQMEEEKESVYLQLAGHEVTPVQPVVDLLMRHYQQMPVSCGTGNLREVALLTLKGLQLEPVLKLLVSADDVEQPKPAPDTFLECARLMGTEPQYCQVFEDGEPGLQAAEAAGMIATDIRSFV